MLNPGMSLQTLRTCARALGRLQLRSASTVALERDPSFAAIIDSDVRAFKDIVGSSGVITDPHELQFYNRDWMGKYQGGSSVALKPKTTQQVSDILAHCNSRRLAVVPQGGNTGLVGGSVPVFDEVVLSMGGMNTITSFDRVSGALVCQAGCVLEALDTYLAGQGCTVPLDLGAKGSCQIGGNVATNAGGLRLLRYGSMHANVLGLEVVLPDGRVLDLLSTLRKDNTGYDLKQVFIGSEGTLGVITGVSLLCPPKPTSVNVSYLACPSFPAALQVLVRAKQLLGEVLSAFEFLDRESLDITLQHLPSAKDPLPSSQGPFYLVVETAGSSEEHDGAKLNAFLEHIMDEGLVLDGTIAQDGAQAKGIWYIREGITEALKQRGAVYKYDISLPADNMYQIVEEMRDRLDKWTKGTGRLNFSAIQQDMPVRVVGYGHLGDGNLHLNISAATYDKDLQQQIEPWVYEWTSRFRGSISAEHGIGQMKATSIGFSKPQVAITLMQQTKTLLDPNKILNPYKVLPQFR